MDQITTAAISAVTASSAATASSPSSDITAKIIAYLLQVLSQFGTNPVLMGVISVIFGIVGWIFRAKIKDFFVKIARRVTQQQKDDLLQHQISHNQDDQKKENRGRQQIEDADLKSPPSKST